MLRYLGYQTACDMAFVTFLISWLYTRHFLFGRVILSVIFDLPKAIPFDWIPERGHYITAEAHSGFVALLVSLEVFGQISQMVSVSKYFFMPRFFKWSGVI
jgi:very-long-chain ceramide synthase